MLKERIKYKDYDGVDHEEDFYFNISKPEVTDLQFSTPGGLRTHIKRIVQTDDVVEIYALFKEIVLKSYGEKTPDGKSFIKVDSNGRSLGELFQYHAAYEKLFEKLTTSEDSIAAFINAVTPELTPEERAAAEKAMKEEDGFPNLAVVENNRQTVAPQ